MQWRKDSLFNKWCWENWTATCKTMKLEYFLTPYTQINSKQIKDLNVRPEATKFLQENIGKTFSDINHRQYFFLSLPPKAKEIRAKIKKWDLLNLKAFAQQRKQLTKLKDNLWGGRKYLQMI